MQLKETEEFLHRHFLALELVHHAVGVHTVGPLDEAKEMLLVHAGRCVDVSVDLQGRT